jgi:hypothetical protein
MLKKLRLFWPIDVPEAEIVLVDLSAPTTGPTKLRSVMAN